MAAVGIMVSLLLLLLLWFLCIGIRWIAGSGIESESNYKNINIQFYRFINERTWCIWCAIVTRFSCSKSNRIESPNGRKWNKTISNKNNTKWNIIYDVRFVCFALQSTLNTPHIDDCFSEDECSWVCEREKCWMATSTDTNTNTNTPNHQCGLTHVCYLYGKIYLFQSKLLIILFLRPSSRSLFFLRRKCERRGKKVLNWSGAKERIEQKYASDDVAEKKKRVQCAKDSITTESPLTREPQSIRRERNAFF